MSPGESLARLLNIRRAEERQRGIQMESVLARLRDLRHSLAAASQRAAHARLLIAASVSTGEQIDRIAALEEIAAAKRSVKFFSERVAVAEAEAVSIRTQFLIKRMERRQIESLHEAANARLAIEGSRKVQAELDDRHLAQRVHKQHRG